MFIEKTKILLTHTKLLYCKDAKTTIRNKIFARATIKMERIKIYYFYTISINKGIYGITFYRSYNYTLALYNVPVHLFLNLPFLR